MSVFGMGSESEASAPSKNSDHRLVDYGGGTNTSGNKNRVNSGGYNFSAGDGNTISIIDNEAVKNALTYSAASLESSYRFAQDAMARTDARIASFVESSGQMLDRAAMAATVESSDRTAALTGTKTLLWPVLGLVVLVVWLGVKK